ncbi:hypothetical protein ACFFQF_10745 [Haladaptatus pallidirubidus]|uniref:hypothetical protein n=1 Tax=Haladaptatus pallidirubidus TaxID=1008152 RepID=UPI001D121ABB|nr:hypothetical protein [Haladaptatus pallidirubidus]
MGECDALARLRFPVYQNRRAILMAGKNSLLPVATGERGRERVACHERLTT